MIKVLSNNSGMPFSGIILKMSWSLEKELQITLILQTSAILKFVLEKWKKLQFTFWREKRIYTKQTIHSLACDNFIFPKGSLEGKERQAVDHYSALNHNTKTLIRNLPFSYLQATCFATNSFTFNLLLMIRNLEGKSKGDHLCIWD